MKKLFTLLALILSTNTFAYVDSSQCPEEISIEILQTTKSELNTKIESEWSVKFAWEKMEPMERVLENFSILTRSGTLCVYVGGGKAVYLQTNNFVDELAVPYDTQQSVYFRFKISSFSRKHIDLIQGQEFTLFAPILFIGGDSVTQIGEEKIGQAQAVNLHVKP